MTSDRAWAATRKGLFELRRRQREWRIEKVSFLGDPVSMLLPPDDSGFMLAALNLGHFGAKLQASDDAGQTWRELAAPVFPPQPEGAQGPAWTLLQIWALERAGDRLWAGTIPGGLFESRDRGTSWQLNEALWNDPRRLGWFGGGNDAPALHSICPHPTAPDELLLGISCGGAWRTMDGGRHWALRAAGMRASYMPPEQAGDENVQDPHLIARCNAMPDVLWCQHHNGIFRSGDNGASWTELQAQPSSFGFAVAAHPHDPQTAWFVPALKDERRVPVDGALCVTRTRDAGGSFEAVRAGLPQEHCYDLVLRHGLAVDDSGDNLLMGSATGSLWASADGGTCWQGISSHLPPIYALKFG